MGYVFAWLETAEMSWGVGLKLSEGFNQVKVSCIYEKFDGLKPVDWKLLAVGVLSVE